MAEVRRRLGTARLLTLTGVGGVGKTRLALEAAAASRKGFAGGVWLVDLAPVQDPAAVAGVTASALGIPDLSSHPLLEQLADHLAERQCLIVLDNCEHLVDACAELADSLLSAARDLRILATSRHTLGISGEHVFSVPRCPCRTTPWSRGATRSRPAARSSRSLARADDELRTDRFADGSNDLEREPHPVFVGASVLVVTVVPERRPERVQEAPVGHELDAVEPCGPGSAGRRRRSPAVLGRGPIARPPWQMRGVRAGVPAPPYPPGTDGVDVGRGCGLGEFDSARDRLAGGALAGRRALLARGTTRAHRAAHPGVVGRGVTTTEAAVGMTSSA